MSGDRPCTSFRASEVTRPDGTVGWSWLCSCSREGRDARSMEAAIVAALRAHRHIVDAMAAGSIEVKTDEMAMKTGRVFVEYECKRFGGWAKSGIATTTAELWAFVVASDTVLVVPTVRLRAAVKRVYKLQPGLRKECVRGSHPTRGVAIPLTDIFGHLIKVVA